MKMCAECVWGERVGWGIVWLVRLSPGVLPNQFIIADLVERS